MCTRCKQARPCAPAWSRKCLVIKEWLPSVKQYRPRDYLVHGSVPSPLPRYLIQPLLICVESNLAPSRCRFCYDSPCCPSLASNRGDDSFVLLRGNEQHSRNDTRSWISSFFFSFSSFFFLWEFGKMKVSTKFVVTNAAIQFVEKRD